MVLSYTLLFSSELTGAWQLDMPKMQKTMPMEQMEKSKQLVVALFADMWSKVVFASNGTFKLIKDKQKGIWKKREDRYIIQASSKAPKNRLIILDKRHMKIIFNDANIGKLIFYFKKEDKK